MNCQLVSSCFEAYGVPAKISSSRSLCKGPVPRMKKSMALFHIKNFSYHVTLATFKKKTSTCGSQVGHMGVTSRVFCESVSQIGQQMQTTFNPVLCAFVNSPSYVYVPMVPHMAIPSWSSPYMVYVFLVSWGFPSI